jgi:tripartite-type tricarboxylate transporter receptor subunit TctC
MRAMSRFASAQTYPTRSVTIIVPFAAGGPTDVSARIVAEHVSRTLGQQFIVENVVGAGGTTGSPERCVPLRTATPSRWGI